MSTMLRLSGKVSHWNYARGFGFVQTADEHELVLNIADWVETDMPRVGDRVSFVERQDRSGRPCARSVMLATI